MITAAIHETSTDSSLHVRRKLRRVQGVADQVMGPRFSSMLTAILSVIDAVGVHAVMALNQAHSRLVKERVVAKGARQPSDTWYQLLEQLEGKLTEPHGWWCADGGGDAREEATDGHACELLVSAAAFFAS